MNDVGMDLAQGSERHIGSTESGLEAAAVLEDVFARVPVGEAEVEDVVAVEIADAAGSGAETVDKPREFAERLDLEEAQTAGAR